MCYCRRLFGKSVYFSCNFKCRCLPVNYLVICRELCGISRKTVILLFSLCLSVNNGGNRNFCATRLLCRKLVAEGKNPTVILGFNTADEIFYKEEFEALGVKVYVTTVDGSVGTKGFVTDVMKDLTYSYFFTCGPMPMFKAIENTAVTSGQYSFEERMGCGFGACMGCSCKTKYGNKRICKDGPVLEREEIIW